MRINLNRPFRMLALLFVINSAAVVSGAQNMVAVDIDLATLSPGGKVERTLEPGWYRLVILSAIPERSYSVAIEEKLEFLPPLEKPLSVDTTAAPGGLDCSVYVEKARRVSESFADESALALFVSDPVPKVKEFYTDPMDFQRIGDCRRSLHRDLLEYTKLDRPEPVFRVRRRGVTTVRISRPGRTWTIEYRAPYRGQWLSSYGITFLGERDHQFFSKAEPFVDDEGQAQNRFRLIREDDRRTADLAAMATFTFVPSSQFERDSSWVQGFTAGLGLQSDGKPAAAIGWGIVVADNVTISLGVAGVSTRRLLERYEGVDHISDDLTSDQLTEEVFLPTPFLSISFRLGPSWSSKNGGDSAAGNEGGGTEDDREGEVNGGDEGSGDDGDSDGEGDGS